MKENAFSHGKVSRGVVHIPRRVKDLLNLKDGDLVVWILKDGDLIFKKGDVVPVD